MAEQGSQHALGIDIGGSGIKGAPVDVAAGAFSAPRVKVATPRPATPAAVAEAVAEIAGRLGGHVAPGRPAGVTFPAVIKEGVARSAANVDPSWIGVDVRRLMEQTLGRPVRVLNDADAAAVGEHRFGAAHGVGGVVLLTTLGTGIGSALLVNGELVPNTEFGHLEIDGTVAERWAASSAREREGLSHPEWAARLQRYYRCVEDLLWPDLIVVGGGISRKADRFLPLLRLRTPIVPALLRNTAGAIGAAVLAAEGPPR